MFELKYKNLIVGVLSFSNRNWIFKYSEQFKNQNEVAPLSGFGKVDIDYISPRLWIFFEKRIPPLTQPHAAEMVRDYKIDKDDKVKLLKIFGRFTTDNSFELKFVENIEEVV